MLSSTAKADYRTPDEGMWLPLLLKNLNYAEMERLGCKLSPEQIYSVNNSSVKDAIVQLGGFCTAEVISPKGLLLTNHHCAYDAIRSHSSVENDYLTDGFWAKNHGAELPVKGLTVSFLVRMEDVGDAILKKAANYDGEEREMAIAEQISALEEAASDGNGYRAEVKEMFNGNAYYLFVYQTYSDVRLVGAPPSSIGKFGGDTDNWMWPRHTGDFSMLRIYASKDNNPAEFNADNVPYTPKHFLPVSNKGLSDGDFTMILGYPGGTDRYLTSYGVDNLMKNESPIVIDILKKRLDVMKTAMDQKDEVRIALASDYASLANYWKYSEGQLLGLNKFDLVAEKQEEERAFLEWAEADPDRKEKYGNVLNGINETYTTYAEMNKTSIYLNFAAFGPGFMGHGISIWRLKRKMEAAEEKEDYQPDVDNLKEGLDDMFKEYLPLVDQKVFAVTTQAMYEGLPEGKRPDFFESSYFSKAKGASLELRCQSYAASVFKKSIVTNKKLLAAFLKKPSIKKMEKDPGIQYITSVIDYYRAEAGFKGAMYQSQLDELRKTLMEGLLEKESGKSLYPDANFTMRVTYGTVKPYSSWEGKEYNTFTYASEILDKYKAGDHEFDVPEKLRTLISAKDFGRWGNDGKLPVCFIHDTDITGGNSGSPVINAEGHLVGVAFDGNWESMISDLRFQDDYVRTISVDIRYVLFVVDKYAGASHLIEEMKLIE